MESYWTTSYLYIFLVNYEQIQFLYYWTNGSYITGRAVGEIWLLKFYYFQPKGPKILNFIIFRLPAHRCSALPLNLKSENWKPVAKKVRGNRISSSISGWKNCFINNSNFVFFTSFPRFFLRRIPMPLKIFKKMHF